MTTRRVVPSIGEYAAGARCTDVDFPEELLALRIINATIRSLCAVTVRGEEPHAPPR